MVQSALIAALYTLLTLLPSFMSFGMFQPVSPKR